MVSLAALVSFAGGCAASHKTVVKPSVTPAAAQVATREQLLERYNRQAASVETLNAGVAMKLTSGSAYSGVIEQYHEVNGFIIAAKPSNIRIIGQAPVIGKNIFDMVSDGKTFEIYIPSKHNFLIGPVNLERQPGNPLENLRPQHLEDALLWAPLAQESPALIEESSESNVRYYVLTIVRRAATPSRTADAMDLEIAEKLWFDRSELHIARVESFGSGGRVSSDVRYSDWQPAGEGPAGRWYPHQIDINRPGEDYQLAIHINKLTLNQPVAADRFFLKQPPGTELVRVGEQGSQKPQPGDKEPQP